MGYSLEYKEWTGENVDVEFSITEVSSNLGPDMEKEFTCDGIGFIALLKDSDGQLNQLMVNQVKSYHILISYRNIKYIVLLHQQSKIEKILRTPPQ